MEARISVDVAVVPEYGVLGGISSIGLAQFLRKSNSDKDALADKYKWSLDLARYRFGILL